MAESIESPIGFSDSELEGYARTGDAVTVRVKSWNGTVLLVRFRDVIGQRDLLAGDFSALVRGAAASGQFLQEVLLRSYTTVPATHPYEVYSFLNNDDAPALEIVAAGCEVSVGTET